MKRLGRVLGISSLGLMIVACSSSSDGGVSGAGGVAGSSAGAASAGEAGTSASGGGGKSGGANGNGGAAGKGGSGGSGGTGGSTNPSKTGQVVFSAYANKVFALIASFSDMPSGAAEHCVETDLDGCSIELCDDSVPAPVTRPTAGTITVTSPDVAGSAVLQPSADGSYGKPQGSFSSTFLGQEGISITASGDEVPAFQDNLTIPLALLRSEPYVDNSDLHTRLYIPSTQDLKLTWTRGAPDVWLIVDASTARVDGKPGTAALYCAFPSEAGTGTVRSSLLKQLEQEALLRNLTVLIKRTTVADYAVTLATTIDVYDETKKFEVSSTLQLHDP